MRADPFPQPGEDPGDVVQAPGEVVGPPEAVRRIDAPGVHVRLPGERRGHARRRRLLAGVGHGRQHLGPGHGEHDAGAVPVRQLAHRPPGGLGSGAGVAHGDGHLVAPAAVADVREVRRQRAQYVGERGPERGQSS